MSPSKNNVRRGSQWEPPEVPPFMTNGIANLYAERESPIPNVMTSPALLPDSSYQDDGHLKTGYNCNGATSKKISEEDLSCSSNDLPPPPDGGWGWMVVFASFMIHIIGKSLFSPSDLPDYFFLHIQAKSCPLVCLISFHSFQLMELLIRLVSL